MRLRLFEPNKTALLPNAVKTMTDYDGMLKMHNFGRILPNSMCAKRLTYNMLGRKITMNDSMHSLSLVCVDKE